jgi:hypothetical protein
MGTCGQRKVWRHLSTLKNASVDLKTARQEDAKQRRMMLVLRMKVPGSLMTRRGENQKEVDATAATDHDDDLT